jgi:hypothetical protein
MKRKRPAAGIILTAGRHKSLVREVLEHAEHDRANKGECDIGGNNAQSADQSHGKTSLVDVAARCNATAGKPFPPKKSALLQLATSLPPKAAGHVVKKS